MVDSYIIILGRKYLLLDDIEENTYLVNHILNSNKANAIVVNRAEEALEKYRVNTDIDAIVTDLRMPGMSGQQFIMEVRRLEHLTGRRAVPIIVLTGESDPEERMLCLTKYGANEYLLKPIPLSDLMQSLYRVFQSLPVRKLNILLVDDEPMSSFFMSKVLSGQGHITILCTTVKEVLLVLFYFKH